MVREHVRPLPKSWWLRKGTYFSFMVRELTSVFVAGYAVFLLVLVGRAADVEAFGRFFEVLRSPWSVALHVVALAMVLFHAITWINLLPKVVVLWRGEERVSPGLIAAVNYLAWLLFSGLVGWLALR